MSSPIRLVPACIDDASALSAAGERLFVQAYGNYSDPDDLAAHVSEYFGRDAVAAELEQPGVGYTIAYEDDAIAGFIKMRRGRAPAAIPATDAVEVQQLYVDASRQRKGIGSVLMDHAVAAAREEGYPGVWLSVWQVADWATAFYEAYGFRAAGTVEFWLGRTRYTDYLMWLEVSRDR